MNYYDEVNSYVKKVEIGKAIRETNANMELVECYWNVGRLIVEAQGGKEKSTYGNELLKDWSAKLTKEFGTNYGITNLKYMRLFHNFIEKGHPLDDQLTWSHYKLLLPLKNLGEIKYYINIT